MKHMVTYYHPGSFVNEETNRQIETRDSALALSLAPNSAFAFQFYDVAEAPDLGPEFKVHPVPQNESGLFYIGGGVYTLDEVEQMDHGTTENLGLDILISNMRGNGWSRVIKCRTGNWQPFNPGDCVV